MFLRRLSIRSRFFILLIVAILLWLFIGFILYSYLISYRKSFLISDKILTLTHQSLQLNNTVTEFMYYDLNSNAFFETGESQRSENFEPIYRETYNQISELKTEKILQKNPLIYQKLEHFSEQLISTGDMFHTLTSKLKERGNKNYGLHNLALSRMDDFREITAKLDRRNLYNLFNQLNDIVLRYLDQPSQYAAKQMNDKIQEVRSSLDSRMSVSSSTPRSFDMTQIISLFNNIDEYLHSIVSIDHELGYSQTDGLKNQLKSAAGILSEDTNAMNTLFKTDLTLKNRKIGISMALIIILTITIFILLIYNITRSVQRPLDQVNSFTKDLVKGKFPAKLTEEGQDEITEISNHLNTFTRNLKEKVRFAGEIGRKEGTPDVHLLSEDDILGNALLEMGNYLQTARIEDQKHQAENEKRRWINEGLAKFEEILRIHSSHLETLADQIIQNLVRYLDADVGAIFLSNPENENQLEMAAAFAFDRKKYIERTFQLGEGLVGTCAIEKQKIFLTDIPENYIQITSGLGDSKPRCLLLIPLRLESEVMGVIEIASLKILQEHEIFFVETIAGSIASAISGVRINMRTSLLLEQSQKQAREMAEQEAKYKEHLKELQSAQEESARKESEIKGILSAIKISSLVAEYNLNEELLSINDKFLFLLETHRDHVIGKRNFEVLGLNRFSEPYKDQWQKLREDKTVSNIEKIKLVTGNEIWLRQTYTPILDQDSKPFKVLNISIDITETIRQQESLEKQANEISRANMEMKSFSDAVDQALIKCVYSSSGQILEINENFEKITGYTRKEMIGKNNRIFLQRLEKEQFEKIWADIIKDKPYSGVIRRTKPAGEEVWIMSTFTPVKDENGVIFKVYFLGQDITEKRLKYQLLEEANREIERLINLSRSK